MKFSVKITYNIASIGNCNFWGITKCGNTTIKYKLLKKFRPDLLRKVNDVCRWVHHPDFMPYLTPAQANSNGKYNFTFIRNPIFRFESMYKDFGLRRQLRGNIIDSPEKLLDTLRGVKQDEASANVHLRSISYFLKDFTGDIFDINDLDGIKINQTKKNYKINSKLKEEVTKLWIDDFAFFEKVQNINKFTLLLEA